METKAGVLLSGAIVALLLVTRYFALSRTSMPLGWMLYFGLPVTAAGVLFAVRLINLGAGWHTAAQIFGATGGYYCRYAISHTEGATFGPHPTAEDIAGNWDRIRDRALPNELDGEAMAWGIQAYSARLKALAVELQMADLASG